MVAEASPGAVSGVRAEREIFFPEHMGGSTADKTGTLLARSQGNEGMALEWASNSATPSI